MALWKAKKATISCTGKAQRMNEVKILIEAGEQSDWESQNQSRRRLQPERENALTVQKFDAFSPALSRATLEEEGVLLGNAYSYIGGQRWLRRNKSTERNISRITMGTRLAGVRVRGGRAPPEFREKRASPKKKKEEEQNRETRLKGGKVRYGSRLEKKKIPLTEGNTRRRVEGPS